MTNFTILFSSKNNPKEIGDFQKTWFFLIPSHRGNQVFLYHVLTISSLNIMNIEMLSLILIFLTLEYFKNHYMYLLLKII